MFLQRTDMSCSNEFAALMARAVEKLNKEQTYAVLEAPAPYVWETENWITHDTALNMNITCMISLDFKPCGDPARCVTCQAIKGNQWQKDCCPMFMEAIGNLRRSSRTGGGSTPTRRDKSWKRSSSSPNT